MIARALSFHLTLLFALFGSSVPSILNHDHLHGDRQRSTVEDQSTSRSESSTDSEKDLRQFDVRQTSPPSALPHANQAPTTQVPSMSNTRQYRTIYVPDDLITCFYESAEENTKNNLGTCGIIAGTSLSDQDAEYFVATTLIIPKQKATHETCEATNEEEILEAFEHRGCSYLGWIHTHPTQSCFMSSADLHNHYSYQMDLPEAFAIVVPPSKRKLGIYHLIDPDGMDVIAPREDSIPMSSGA